MDLKNKLLLKKINYSFRDEALLSQALVHSSYSNKHNNQALEFIGDSVLSLSIAEILFRTKKYSTAGELTKARSLIVNNENLAKTMRFLGLEDYIVLGKGQKLNQNIAADSFESLIGGIFLDGGYAASFLVLNFIYKKHWSKISDNTDFKSQLQELLHKQKKNNAQYKVLKSQGPSHDKNFTIGVFISNSEIARAMGKNRKTAEQKAAKAALEYLKNTKV